MNEKVLLLDKKLIFILENCLECDKNNDCRRGKIRMKRVNRIIEKMRPEQTIFLNPKDEGTKEKLKKFNLPEVWMHDFDREGNETDVIPYGEYYFVLFPDGTRRCAIIVDEDFDEEEEEIRDPMFG